MEELDLFAQPSITKANFDHWGTISSRLQHPPSPSPAVLLPPEATVAADAVHVSCRSHVSLYLYVSVSVCISISHNLSISRSLNFSINLFLSF